MNHTCIGCGICVGVCPRRRIRMEWSHSLGRFFPNHYIDDCDTPCDRCERVCPFSSSNADTLKLSEELFANVKGICFDDTLGFYSDAYAGFSDAHRALSASGGIGTALLEQLLASGAVDRVWCVGPCKTSPTLFAYRLCSTREEVRACSSSCYQPVEMSTMIRTILESDRQVAITALPCVIRGIRLAQKVVPELRSRIVYVVGLVCGQMKSRRFIDYLGYKYCHRETPTAIRFRAKRMNRSASDYAYAFEWPDNICELGFFDRISPIWGQRWFTLEACDYCDDIFAECGDIALMDAWLPEYSRDPKGHNIVLIRHPELAAHFRKSDTQENWHLETLTGDQVRRSQHDVVLQKRVFSYLNSRSEKRPGYVQHVRCPAQRIRIDHRLESWTKRHIRAISSEWTPQTAHTVESKIAWIAFPWKIVRTIVSITCNLKRGIFANR
jgi:coenzyme F420 hydrogenase subunit beta